METNAALDGLSALAHEHRLAVFRILVRAGDSGMLAGEIAQRLDIRPSSLSFHLSNLKRGGMVFDERRGRAKIYRANFATMQQLLGYLLENCCAGDDRSATGNVASGLTNNQGASA